LSAAGTDVRRRLTGLLGRVGYTLGVHRVAFRDRALVVLFHRVDDRYGHNAISCTVGAFEAYCRFFRAHFDVVPLSHLLDLLEAGRPVGGKLVITFDDGYLDNATTAGPILRASGLPASFFIATEFIGSRRVPWWDEEVGIQSEWMSWDQVRGLAAQGFEIGSHTLNHVDLGVVQGEEAWTEITRSGERLESELGRPVSLFSYPYGRRHQITEANRELVRKAGYRCCLSAYGGAVGGAGDPFDLKRLAVSPWFRSPSQFGFEVLSLRT
jgi:peptidoglycan/xylan/chitin deacetylase (PgdA/CDA1 family)